jgi:hypothetical protein
MMEYEHSPPIWFEVWDLPTHVPTHGGPPSSDEHYYGEREENNDFTKKRRNDKEYLRMNAWEAHDVLAYQEELRRSHTDPSTGLVSLLKKDHDAVFCVIPASTFSSSSVNLDETMDALLDDVGFLNDNTKNEVLRVLVVSKIDELSPDELDGILLQVSSYAEVSRVNSSFFFFHLRAELSLFSLLSLLLFPLPSQDKCIDYVTTSARTGRKVSEICSSLQHK